MSSPKLPESQATASLSDQSYMRSRTNGEPAGAWAHRRKDYVTSLATRFSDTQVVQQEGSAQLGAYGTDGDFAIDKTKMLETPRALHTVSTLPGTKQELNKCVRTGSEELACLDQEGVGSQEPPAERRENRGVREEKTEQSAAALALLLGALHGAPGRSEEYDYYGWQTEPLHGRSYSKPPQCLDIPADLPLCHTVGYKRMRLPNLLEHESLAEVKQQASSWLPLLAKRCHSDTQVFLCSLFAPVCLDRPIYPCRSLCEAVRAGCAPLMEAYGFPWPEMLHCHKFPLDNDLCIAVQFGHLPATAPPVTKICAQCEMEHSADGLMEQMCSSDFVVKMRIREIKIENADRKLIGAQKKKKLLKPGPLKRKDTKRLVLHMKNGAGCPCPQLESLAGSFLVMGRKVDGQLLLTAVYRWDKKNKEMKFAVKFMFSYPCSLYYPFFYGAAEPH
ncbi:secreted frizzled-related protein 5 [Neophocaena asiaeorientalis asiaeorientalis]|uniref:Secreted frizzled-related protein 5 n=1 Tax=Neophocaena asiaeorientalis asiaeorientalis TaxID=1706337 RepID=A0A341ALJ8_NEOAA|nr:secreted frizzled-related protein 5 [Neophocaena asiaeorientalis asiaeorientalis]